jgi:predicted nucleic acid-binding protein
MIVIDASAVLEILKRTETGAELETAIAGHTLHAPHLIDIEVASALRRWELHGEMKPADAAAALEVFARISLRRHPHDAMLKEIWHLRSNLTVYDAAYVALAKSLQAELLTMDSGLRSFLSRGRAS